MPANIVIDDMGLTKFSYMQYPKDGLFFYIFY